MLSLFGVQFSYLVRLEVLTALNMKIPLFWDMILCSLVKKVPKFRRNTLSPFPGTKIINIVLLLDMTKCSLLLTIRRNMLHPSSDMKSCNITFWDVTQCSLVDTCVSEEPVAAILRPDEFLDYDTLMFGAVKFGR
jgi:hypothetical protein